MCSAAMMSLSVFAPAFAVVYEFPKDKLNGKWTQETNEHGTLAVDIQNTTEDELLFEFTVEDENYSPVSSDQWRSNIAEGDKLDQIKLPASMLNIRTVWFQFKNPGIHYLCLKTTPVDKPVGMFNSLQCRKVKVNREAK